MWLLLLLLFSAHQHKAAGRKTTLDIQNYGCNGNVLCCHGVVERSRISSLQSHGKALEKECCLPGIFCDSGDMPANLLCELNGHLMPCTSCFYGKWVEDVCAITIFTLSSIWSWGMTKIRSITRYYKINWNDLPPHQQSSHEAELH